MRAVFITHADSDIGGGHLSRCFALSQALELCGVQSSWILNEASRSQANALKFSDAVFLCNPFSYGIERYFENIQFAIVDSYLPTADFYAHIAQCLPVVVIDDLADRDMEAYSSILINYGICASRDLYARANECGAKTKYLLGPKYALLRKEYWNMSSTAGSYILFVSGASDVLSASEGVVSWWRETWPQLIVVLGSLVPEVKRFSVQRLAANLPNVTVAVNPNNFASLLAESKMVFCSASVTAYEALAMKKRTAVFSVATNQIGLGEALEGVGAAYNLGPWPSVTPEKLEKALSFLPDRRVLNRLVRKDGAIVCAEALLLLMEGICGD